MFLQYLFLSKVTKSVICTVDSFLVTSEGLDDEFITIVMSVK